MNHPPQQSVYGDEARPEVRPLIPSGVTSALDVGCGRGGFGRTLRDLLGEHARIVGIDAVEENVRQARVGHGFDEVVLGYFPDAMTPPSERYDLIIFLDVLEHVLDPWNVLRAARDHLNPGGRVVAAIPSIQMWKVLRGLIKGRWDYTEMGTLDRTHVRFFTKATMIELFEGAGFQVDECRGVNSQKPRLRPVRGIINRRMLKDMKWLPTVLPDSQWLHFVVVGRMR
ncbi:class I SAM-dependent methyltransferase [Intrasporangium sp. DVR]|uniref:class I SAM-dependent methyltransferase n=1 Tax=Intrasporangium sp. DVR TaxID=3127867 RepID=UPI00313A64AD